MFNTPDKYFPGASDRMLQVTPVRAFADNYIWLIHSPRDRAAGRRGRSRRCRARSNRRSPSSGLAAFGHPAHASSRRSRRRCRRLLQTACRAGLRTGQRSGSRRSRRGCAKATMRAFDGARSGVRRARRSRAYRRPHRLCGPWRGVLRRHAVQCRLRPAVRRHRGTNGALAGQTRGAAAETLRCTARTNTR